MNLFCLSVKISDFYFSIFYYGNCSKMILSSQKADNEGFCKPRNRFFLNILLVAADSAVPCELTPQEKMH